MQTDQLRPLHRVAGSSRPPGVSVSSCGHDTWPLYDIQPLAFVGKFRLQVTRSHATFELTGVSLNVGRDLFRQTKVSLMIKFFEA